MRPMYVVIAALGLAGTLSLPALTDPPARTVVWQCVLEDGRSRTSSSLPRRLGTG
jgi:hypothetical protein